MLFRSVQARDVFDLGVLLARAGNRLEALQPVRAQLPRAVERAMEISYGDFKAQVASYLQPDLIDTYGSREAWDALQMLVVERLEQGLS